ncbi:MAG: PadR family transcriptional regulator [Oscillospiraceae bacterium]|nr:PadR family transcriptional regulator [Oscillospiraceae bacterium]
MPYNGGPMTEAMYYVLLALMNPGHGYRLMNAISEISGGRVSMGPGTLYGVLTRMQKDGLILIAEDDGRRKTYAITDSGKAALKEEYNRLKAMVSDGAIIDD